MGKRKETSDTSRRKESGRKAKALGVRTPEEQYLLDRYAKLNAKRLEAELKLQSQKKEEEPKERPKVPLKTLLEQIPPSLAPAISRTSTGSVKVKRRIPQKLDELTRTSSTSSVDASPYQSTPPFATPPLSLHPPSRARAGDVHSVNTHESGSLLGAHPSFITPPLSHTPPLPHAPSSFRHNSTPTPPFLHHNSNTPPTNSANTTSFRNITPPFDASGQTPPFAHAQNPAPRTSVDSMGQTPPFGSHAGHLNDGSVNPLHVEGTGFPRGYPNQRGRGNVLQGRGGPLQAPRIPRNQCIVITNIQPGTHAHDIEMIFTAFGKVETLCILPQQRTGVVKYESFEEAELARDATNRALICGAVIHVEWADDKRFQEVLEMGVSDSKWSTQYPTYLPCLVSYDDLDPIFYQNLS